jgi:hypothetical protein
MDERMWTIKIWDGWSNQEFERYGTYEQIRGIMVGYPPSYIWSITCAESDDPSSSVNQ